MSSPALFNVRECPMLLPLSVYLSLHERTACTIRFEPAMSRKPRRDGKARSLELKPHEEQP
jgi:hypothetical protein